MTSFAIPPLACLLCALAVLIVWRRRPTAIHAATWSAAFAITGLGWVCALIAGLIGGIAKLPGVAGNLAWLAGALLFVHGLRQRARRSDRSAVLAAIWAAIAFFTSVLNDVVPAGLSLQAASTILAAIGLLLGAVAVGPRRRRHTAFEWAAMAMLATLAMLNLLLALIEPGGQTDIMVAMAVPPIATLFFLACGLGAMLLLTNDLSLALERLARTDPLTCVWNRRGFDEAAPYLLERLRRSPGVPQASVAIADIDAFKTVNDRFGHAAGDAVLTHFADLLGEAVHRGDLLARLGGEEFALLAIGVGPDVLRERVEQVRQGMTRPETETHGLPVVTASFGVAEVCPRTLALRDALERADHALYRAKKEGRNRTVVDDLLAAGG